jgi:hypothetical protein
VAVDEVNGVVVVVVVEAKDVLVLPGAAVLV